MPFRVQWAGTCQRWTVALATCLPPRLRTRLRRLLAGPLPQAGRNLLRRGPVTATRRPGALLQRHNQPPHLPLSPFLRLRWLR